MHHVTFALVEEHRALIEFGARTCALSKNVTFAGPRDTAAAAVIASSSSC
jgi:hypothetical protein